MATAREIDPFLKADLPTRAPKHHGQRLPRCAPGFPPYDTGARSHMSYKLTQNAKMANRRTRSMQPHRGCAPFQLRCSRRSSMETRAHMSCNRRTGYHVQRNCTATCAKVMSSRGYRTSATTRGNRRMTQQCQLSTTVTGQSAAGIGTTVDMTIGGSAVIAATDMRKQRSNHQPGPGPTSRLASSLEAAGEPSPTA
jgi:hypothetical protein